MYTQFFGLREKPFSITPDPRYLYMSQRHADALAHLIYGISQSGGFIQLTGEVGTGKTTLVRSLFEQVPDEADVALILNPELSTQDFLTAISEELGVTPPAERSTKALVDGLNAYLLDAHARGRRTVLIVDEAQNLATDVLEQVRLLTNLETPKQKLLQIILIGQPELREVLAREDMRQLAQRVTGRYHLEPLSQEDTAKYVEHRMKVAGATGGIFTGSAMREIYRWSKGVPRLINVIADRSLLGGYTQDSRTVDKPLVRRAAAEVYGDRFVPVWQRRLAAVIAVAGTVLLLAGLWRTVDTGVASSAPDAAPAERVTRLAEVEIPLENAGVLTSILADDTLPKDTDSAFEALFGLWSAEFVRGAGSACAQAEEQGLRCWFQKGTISHIRRLNRPVILNLIDAQGDTYQVVLNRLSDDRATLTVGGRTHVVALDEVSRYWYGEHLMLWRPGSRLGNDLAPGSTDEGVRWLRGALTQIQGAPAGDAESELFDPELEARVRDYQRSRRLTVDGIVGTQTQIVMNTDLALPGTPLLFRAQ